jgi:toxin-antitoxin system PIN domain toxin
VIVVDANLLIYSYDTESPHHKKSRAWVEKIFSDIEPVGLPWQTVSAFLRVITNRRLPGSRLTVEQAIEIVEAWLEQPNIRIIVAGDDHWSVLKRMIMEGRATGPLVSDAELVALTVEYGAVLYTADRDFARFPGLRWKNPLS